MRVKPTMNSRIAIFESHLHNGWKHPVYAPTDSLNYFERAWEYVTSVPNKEKPYYNYGINKEIDPDVECLEVVVTDHDGTIMVYTIPFDKKYTKFKFNPGPDDLFILLSNL